MTIPALDWALSMELGRIVAATVLAVILLLWAWYSFLALASILIWHQPETVWEGTEITLREMPIAVLVGFLCLVSVFHQGRLLQPGGEGR